MKTLAGLCILNTRTAEQGAALSKAIVEAGGKAIHLPALDIHPTNNWLQDLPSLDSIAIAIFISSNAVNYFFKEIPPLQWPHHIYVIAMGKGTAATLASLNIAVHDIPEETDSEHLIELDVLKKPVKGLTLIIKGEGGRSLIGEMLTQRKANILSLDVYRRALPDYPAQKIKAIWQENRIDIILFLSFEAMQNIFTLFGKEGHAWLCSKTCVVISQRLAKLAKKLGIKNIVICPYDNLLATLADYNQGRRHDRD